MLPVYQEKEFYDTNLACPKCDWKGLGYDAVVIDFFGVSNQHEIHCPECDNKIGIMQKNEGPPGESATDLSFQMG